MVDTQDHERLAEAIRRLEVRGAPALGVAGAMGVALAAIQSNASNLRTLRSDVRRAAEQLRETRPTAVNLGWGIDRGLGVLNGSTSIVEARDRLEQLAAAMVEEDIAINKTLGANGAGLIPDGAAILTHCNAGALATVGYGTALGVLRAARQAGKQIRVFATETRPLLQGSRLTAWELQQDGFDVTLIADTMVGSMMQQGLVDAALVGADRIAANGDVANKIGTYQIAVLAREHRLPFYVAAPASTIDLSTRNGEAIVIEERDPDEVRGFGGRSTAPHDVAVRNPAFDVTPARYVKAIVTERGVATAPYDTTIAALFSELAAERASA